MSAALLAVGAVVLLVSGAVHLRNRAGLEAALRRHGVLPQGLQRLTAALLPPVQLALGVGLGVVLAAGAHAAARALGLVAASLFLAFAAYLHRASRAPGAAAMPCGCGLGEAPLGVWVVVRALVLSVISAVGAVGAVGSPAAGGLVEVVVSAAAVLALVVAISVLPAARAVPAAWRS